MAYCYVNIDLGDVDIDELLGELEGRGYECVKRTSNSRCVALPDNLDHVEHLLTCGQREIARAEALELCGKAIGRPL